MPNAKEKGDVAVSFSLNRNKLRVVRRREGRYLLRTNLCDREPTYLWHFYIQLVEVEAAFKNPKDDLGLRPIYHQLEDRIEAHIFIAFMAYCLQVTLRARLKPLAGGLTARAVLAKMAAIQMLDVHFSTTDGRTLVLSRYTELTADQKILVHQLNLTMPSQPPPRITAAGNKAIDAQSTMYWRPFDPKPQFYALSRPLNPRVEKVGLRTHAFGFALFKGVTAPTSFPTAGCSTTSAANTGWATFPSRVIHAAWQQVSSV
jgi:hypothetical protein